MCSVNIHLAMALMVVNRPAYTKECFHREGVGSPVGPFGQALGGITGAGSHRRVHEALQQLELNFSAGDSDIDVVGFRAGQIFSTSSRRKRSVRTARR
jgi:hypothetical protein